MTILSRWIAPAVLAAGIGIGALAPAPAQAQDEALARVLVDVADVVLQGGVPYLRGGGRGDGERLFVGRDRYGRPLYYRQLPRHRSGPPYGHAYGYWRNGPGSRRFDCDRHGRCDASRGWARPDRDDRYERYDRDEDRDRDAYAGDRDRRWRDDD